MHRRDRGRTTLAGETPKKTSNSAKAKTTSRARPSPVTLWSKHLVPPIIPLE